MNNIQNQIENAPVVILKVKPDAEQQWVAGAEKPKNNYRLVPIKIIKRRKFFKRIVKAMKERQVKANGFAHLTIGEHLVQWARSVDMESKIGGLIYPFVRRINADGNRLIKCGNLGFQEVVKGEVAFPVNPKKRVIVEEEINDENFAEKLNEAAEKHAADQKAKKERKKKPKKEPKFKVPKESGKVEWDDKDKDKSKSYHRGGTNEDPLWRAKARVGHRTKDWDAAVTFIDGWDEKNPKRNGTNSWDRWDETITQAQTPTTVGEWITNGATRGDLNDAKKRGYITVGDIPPRKKTFEEMLADGPDEEEENGDLYEEQEQGDAYEIDE